jgi:uncharacterized protein involved in exopolysaccharide biosynthesis
MASNDHRVNAPTDSADGLTISWVWELIRINRVLIASITIAFAGLGVAYSLLATEQYRSEVVVAPSEKRAGMSAALGQLGGLASLAGVSLPGGADQVVPIAVLKSNELARNFIVEKDLLLPLTEPRMPWDLDTPDIRDALKVFNEDVRRVTEDKKTGLVTLSVTWRDPVVASSWANELIKRVNEKMRQKALSEAERNVAYLQKEIATSSVVSLQQSMGRVLESEMQKLMLARGNEEFAFRVIDPATPPKLRSWPKRTLISVIATFAGLFFSLTWVFLRQAVREANSATKI